MQLLCADVKTGSPSSQSSKNQAILGVVPLRANTESGKGEIVEWQSKAGRQ